MSSSFTNFGERLRLVGNGSDGSIARVATKLKLYTTAGTPTKAGAEGAEFVPPATAHGYAPIAITGADWTFSVVGGVGRATLADKAWTAAGGTIPNVAGAYLTDAADAVIAWWERVPQTVADGQSIGVTGLYAEG